MPNQARTPEEIEQDLHREIGRILTDETDRRPPAHIDTKRYRKVRWFFAKAFISVIWWDIVLNRPILSWFRTPPLPRWQKIARNYRLLAVEMGGVLIKLGQFLSIRVDILPPEVTGELAGLLQDLPCKVNLIPYNAVTDTPFAKPPLATQQRFKAVLAKAHIPVTIRYSKGRNIDAACGQLRRRNLNGEPGPASTEGGVLER